MFFPPESDIPLTCDRIFAQNLGEIRHVRGVPVVKILTSFLIRKCTDSDDQVAPTKTKAGFRAALAKV